MVFSDPVRGTRFPTSAYFLLIQDIDCPTEPIFLPFMSRLRRLDIFIEPEATVWGDINVLSLLIRSLCISLTTPSTLEQLRLNIDFDAYDTHSSHERFYVMLMSGAI